MNKNTLFFLRPGWDQSDISPPGWNQTTESQNVWTFRGRNERFAALPHQPHSSDKNRNSWSIPVGLSFSQSVALYILLEGFCCCKKNTWKKVGWQILVSQTLEASPFAKGRRNKEKKNKLMIKEKKKRQILYFPEYQLSLRQAPR